MINSLLSFSFGQKSQLLVCETDGFTLRGAVLSRTGGDISVLYKAQSQQADMADSVAELINSLKSDGWEGGEAVLLSPTVLSTLIELPVDPKKPRPSAQMQELIRWEAEPLLMQHTTQWSVGHLLVGRGYMTEEQASAVIDLQQGKANAAGGLALADNFSLRRFGDLAEELGYIRPSQLKACLASQEWLKAEDEAIECGWSPQAEVSDVPGTYSWLVTCVNKTLLQRWTKEFSNQGVVLQAMYPLAGSSASLIPDNEAPAVVLESHIGLAFVMQVSGNKIISQHQYINPAKQALQSCLESYHTLNPPANAPIWLADWHDESDGLFEELSHTLDVDLKVLNKQPIGVDISPGMLGAATHALGLSGKERCAEVRLGGPLPVLWQRVEVRLAALCIVMMLIIMGAELSLLIRDSSISSHKEEVDAQWKTINGAMQRIKGDIKQVEKRKALLKEQEIDQLRTKARLDFFGKDIPEREALVQAILGILQNAVGDDVIINKVDEFGRRATLMPIAPSNKPDTRVEVENFNLEAWALTETAAQSFIQQMEEAVSPWQMEVRDSHVVAALGPMSLEGFTVSMRLVKLVSAEMIKQQKAIR
ncbi:MAG: hypothetical protein COA90_02065 [Gammaproteobacteria bacterium]|nr:MAG: hypothetical protein COA90_02065 [Gammaproteobacteria bacterium]